MARITEGTAQQVDETVQAVKETADKLAGLVNRKNPASMASAMRWLELAQQKLAQAVEVQEMHY